MKPHHNPAIIQAGGRAIIRVIRPTGRDRWCVCIGVLELPHKTQRDALREAVTMAYRHIFCAGRLSQVVLHGKDGRIRWERTYPRSSDPKRSKG